jgi:hypothetical protein
VARAANVRRDNTIMGMWPLLDGPGGAAGAHWRT